MQVGDGNQGAAVGTTIALLERGSRVMSAIHKSCYAAMKDEFRLLAKAVGQYLPPEYPYDVVGGQRNVKQTDFDQRIDVIPCLLYTSPSPRDRTRSRMPSSA